MSAMERFIRQLLNASEVGIGPYNSVYAESLAQPDPLFGPTNQIALANRARQEAQMQALAQEQALQAKLQELALEREKAMLDYRGKVDPQLVSNAKDIGPMLFEYNQEGMLAPNRVMAQRFYDFDNARRQADIFGTTAKAASDATQAGISTPVETFQAYNANPLNPEDVPQFRLFEGGLPPRETTLRRGQDIDYLIAQLMADARARAGQDLPYPIEITDFLNSDGRLTGSQIRRKVFERGD